MELELAIHTNKKAYKQMFIFGLILFLVVASLFFYVSARVSPGLSLILTRGLFVAAMIGVVTLIFYSLYRVLRVEPMAVVSPSGIWIKQFGIIPWSNIQELDAFTIQGIPQPYSLAIQAKDVTLLSKQASIAGKLILYESKVLNCPTIVIDKLELDSQTILNFASQYMEHNSVE